MLMTAVLPVTLRQVTGPPMLKVPNAMNDPVPEGFSPEGPLDALMLMFVKIPPLPVAVAVSRAAVGGVGCFAIAVAGITTTVPSTRQHASRALDSTDLCVKDMAILS